ncbi:MAG: hypothetical protein QNJ22_11760 [Desulfosarcinaceae bacterium]|nr:hypothetical protein [Desulfosarcinaceae bacterium]
MRQQRNLFRMVVSMVPTALILMACAAPNGGHVTVGWGDPQEPPAQEERVKSHKSGPPAHAPAHGYRAKHSYRYYPNERTYYDTERRLYFYLEGRGWRVGASLPGHIQLSTTYVSIELSTDKPYEHHDEHRRKYPPGKKHRKDKRKHQRGLSAHR